MIVYEANAQGINLSVRAGNAFHMFGYAMVIVIVRMGLMNEIAVHGTARTMTSGRLLRLSIIPKWPIFRN